MGLVGVFGVTNLAVSRQTREIGIRMALGARGSQVQRAVFRHAMALVGAGVAAGLGAAFGLTRFLERFPFDVGSRDPVTFAGVALGRSALAAVAIYLPATRATRVEPVILLRELVDRNSGPSSNTDAPGRSIVLPLDGRGVAPNPRRAVRDEVPWNVTPASSPSLKAANSC